jgi:hypothetical protein
LPMHRIYGTVDPMQTCKILDALSLRVVNCRNPICHWGVLQLALKHQFTASSPVPMTFSPLKPFREVRPARRPAPALAADFGRRFLDNSH